MADLQKSYSLQHTEYVHETVGNGSNALNTAYHRFTALAHDIEQLHPDLQKQAQFVLACLSGAMTETSKAHHALENLMHIMTAKENPPQGN